MISLSRQHRLQSWGIGTFILLLSIVLAGIAVHAKEVRLRWTSLMGNGARVASFDEHSATFLLPGQAEPAGSTSRSDAFAYLLSQRVSLPARWTVIRLTGRWWVDPGEDPNAGDVHVAIGLFGRYPTVPHGLAEEGEHLTHFLQISHSAHTTGPDVVSAGEGRIGKSRAKVALTAPLNPRPFILEVRRHEHSSVSWTFHERVDGHWTIVARGGGLFLFPPQTGAGIYVRIGAWGAAANTNERKAYFDTIRLHVFTESKEQGKIQSARKEHLSWRQGDRSKALVVRMNKVLRICLKHVSLPPGATNTAEVTYGAGMSIRNTGPYGPQNFIVPMKEDELKLWFLRHPPAGEGWIAEIGNGRIIWWRGKAFVSIQYGRTGVDDLSSFLLYCTDAEWTPCRPRFLRVLPVNVRELLPAEVMRLGVDITLDGLRRGTGQVWQARPVVGYFVVKTDVSGLAARLVSLAGAGLVPLQQERKGEGVVFRWNRSEGEGLSTLHLMRLPSGDTLVIAACWRPAD